VVQYSEPIGPGIGRSNYRTLAEFDAAVGAKYQSLVDQGYALTRRVNLLKPSENPFVKGPSSHLESEISAEPADRFRDQSGLFCDLLPQLIVFTPTARRIIVVMDHGPFNRSQETADSGSAMIVPQQTAEPFPAFDFPGDGSDFRFRIDQPVFQTLMISFGMVKQDVGFQRGTQQTFTEENHSAQSFGFQASHKSFEVRIQIRTSRGEQDRFHTGAVGQVFPAGWHCRTAMILHSSVCHWLCQCPLRIAYGIQSRVARLFIRQGVPHSPGAASNNPAANYMRLVIESTPD